MFEKIERESIQIEAQAILKRFSDKLSNVDLGDIKTEAVGSGMRRTGKNIVDEDFRRRMFENAPNKKGDFILAEKKQWQE